MRKIEVDKLKEILNKTKNDLNLLTKPKQVKQWSKYYASAPGEVYTADLTFFGKRGSKKLKTILTIVDNYNHEVGYILLKNKSKSVVMKAIKEYLSTKYTKENILLITDDGHEFEVKDVYMDDGRIISNKRSVGEGVAKLAEAYNAVLKKTIQKIIIVSEIPALKLIIDQPMLNTIAEHVNSKHEMDKHIPYVNKDGEVVEDMYIHKDFDDVFGKDEKVKNKFKVGDEVHLSNNNKKLFKKSTMDVLWTKETYIISRMMKYQQHYKYRLLDEDGEEVNAWFYEQEMLKKE